MNHASSPANRTSAPKVVIELRGGYIQRVLVDRTLAEREGLVAELIDFDHIEFGSNCTYRWEDVQTQDGHDVFLETGYVELPIVGCVAEEVGC